MRTAPTKMASIFFGEKMRSITATTIAATGLSSKNRENTSPQTIRSLLLLRCTPYHDPAGV
jgi:hypothetical protein